MPRRDRAWAERVLEAIKKEIDPSTPDREKLGFDHEDVEDMLDYYGFRKQWLYDAVYVWSHPDISEEDLEEGESDDVTIHPVTAVAEEALEQVVNLVEIVRYVPKGERDADE